MEQHDLEQGKGFEEMDADAVCEQCSSVNDEGTLLCKTCGNNLRDQRNRRITQVGGPDIIGDGKSKFQLLTGLLVVFGILVVFYAVWNIDRIEAYMAESLVERSAPGSDDLWTGTEASLYDAMLQDLQNNPTPLNIRKVSLDNPQVERSYSGRYLLIRPGELTTNRIVGEANVRRLGDKIHFVFLSQRGETEGRGYAQFESSEGSDSINVIVRETAEVRIDGVSYVATGVSIPIDSGGHTCIAMREGESGREPIEVLAYRVHSNL
ncbi:MAG: hypothetical protein VCC01_03820 [Candidatus Hydrogenedentota bacterium]